MSGFFSLFAPQYHDGTFFPFAPKLPATFSRRIRTSPAFSPFLLAIENHFPPLVLLAFFFPFSPPPLSREAISPPLNVLMILSFPHFAVEVVGNPVPFSESKQ